MFNKKAQTLSGWTEAAVMILIVITVLGVVIASANEDYGFTCDPTTKENCLPYSNSSLNNFANITKSGQSSINTGEVSFTGLFGFNWIGAWDMSKAILNLIWDIIFGNWIPTAMAAVFGGFSGAIMVGYILQILFVIGLIFALVVLVTKVRHP